MEAVVTGGQLFEIQYVHSINSKDPAGVLIRETCSPCCEQFFSNSAY